MAEVSTPTDLAHGDMELLKIHAHNGAQRASDRSTIILDFSDKRYLQGQNVGQAAGFRLLSESGSGRERRLDSA